MQSASYSPQFHTFDILILGAGGAGLRAAIEAATHGVSVGVVSKVPPTRSHTVAAQGGINAALGNVGEDDWRWHAYDTIRGSDFLGDQDAIRTMCKAAPEAIRDLEAMGVPFTRADDGSIYQRAYGGMSTHYGKGAMAFRACAAADRTGDAMMSGLYEYVQRYPVAFFEEFIVVDLLYQDDGTMRGCLAWELQSGELHIFLSRHTVLATGGYGQIYASATSSSTCTGDGNAFALRAGLPCMDMEFIQFHPTGLYGSGVLISEAARGEGGVLRNNLGERFMERYAPTYKDLASRDVVTRAITQEIAEGRGCGPHNEYIELDLTGLSSDLITRLLPGTASLARELVGVDVTREPIPIIPTAHYTMGGVQATIDGQVVNQEGTIVEGLYCIGEAACNSVHGANRLGCNSLLDLVVFGKRAGLAAATDVTAHSAAALTLEDIPRAAYDKALTRFDRFRHMRGKTDPFEFCLASRTLTQTYAGILRSGEGLTQGMAHLHLLYNKFQQECGLHSTDMRWNNGLVTALETDNLMMQSLATLHAAAWRHESRGAHTRTDFPNRDDKQFLCHSLTLVDDDFQASTTQRSVNMEQGIGEDYVEIPLQERVY